MDFWRKFSAILTLLAFLACLSSAMTRRRVDCQKYVFAPVCRGSTAKRDIAGVRELSEDDLVRYPPQMDEYVAFQADSAKPVNVVDARYILAALLKAAAARSLEYESGNYSSQ